MKRRRLAVAAGVLVVLGTAPVSLTPAEEAEQAPEARVQAIALLNESRWAVQLHRMFEAQPSDPVTDTLQFSGGQLASERFEPSGYAPAPFTLSIGPNGLPVWESTQLSQRDGIVLWRGELDRDTIRGTVSRLPLEGSTEDFQFEGTEILASRPPVETPAVSPPPADNAPPGDSPKPETSTSAEPSSG